MCVGGVGHFLEDQGRSLVEEVSGGRGLWVVLESTCDPCCRKSGQCSVPHIVCGLCPARGHVVKGDNESQVQPHPLASRMEHLLPVLSKALGRPVAAWTVKVNWRRRIGQGARRWTLTPTLSWLSGGEPVWPQFPHLYDEGLAGQFQCPIQL